MSEAGPVVTNNDNNSNSNGEPRAVDANRGVAWWTEAWALFMRNPVLWFALALILIVGFFALNFIPLLGSVAAALLFPVFIGSWMLAARKVDQGGNLEVGDLFSAFTSDKLTPLIVIGALLMAAMVVVGVVGGMLGFGAMFGMGAAGMHRSAGGAMAMMGAGLLAVMVMFVFGALVSMAVWFAPSLVVFRNTPPVDAVRISFSAVLKNVVPFLAFGVLYIVAAIIASIPFGLGWLVLAPVSLLAGYVSYKDVFGGA